jgi:hypothetical protein
MNARAATSLPEALAGHGVVYFGNDWFAENRTSSHHVAKRLSRQVPLLYVDSPGLRPPSGSGRDLKRLVRKLAASFKLPTEIEPGFWHCTVPQVPYRKLPGVDALNRAFGLWAVRRALRHVGFQRHISWFVVPHPGFMAGRLGEALCVYYCIDDYAAHPGVDAARVARADDELTARADQLFVAPPALLEKKKARNASTTFAPHGVDIEIFGRALDPDTEVPEAARKLPGPVVGYFGSIAAWIDVEMIAWLAKQRPQWSFLLVGQPFVDVSALRALPNVHLAGPQPYPTLGAWAKAFDVAIIPYRLNQQVLNANPLKLREYLATGRPIVTVSNPEIERFREWVRIVDGREAFLAGIEAALAPEPEGAAAARVAAVEPMTWDRRVADVLATVGQAMDQRKQQPRKAASPQ